MGIIYEITDRQKDLENRRQLLNHLKQYSIKPIDKKDNEGMNEHARENS